MAGYWQTVPTPLCDEAGTPLPTASDLAEPGPVERAIMADLDEAERAEVERWLLAVRRPWQAERPDRTSARWA